MKSTITAFVFIALVLAACGSNVAKQNVANTVTLPTHPVATTVYRNQNMSQKILTYLRSFL